MEGHPAKANLYLLQSIVEYVSEMGETIMDIMAGTGSIMVAAGMDRRVICMDIEEGFYRLMVKSLDLIATTLPYARDVITVIHGDCRSVLPMPTNHIIFSPPYAQILTTRKAGTKDSTKQLAGDTGKGGSWTPDYSAHPKNVARLNKFLYNQEMEKIYKLCYQSIIPGGTLTIIIQDYIHQQQRVNLSNWVMRSCLKAGFEHAGWFKKLALGTGFKKLWRSRGMEVVSDEDILVFRRMV